MNPKFKKLTALFLAVLMVFATAETTFAGVYSWSTSKTPGNINSSNATVKIPLYKGNMIFKVDTLSGECSYLAAQATSAKPSYYWIDNTGKKVLISKAGGIDEFIMDFTLKGSAEKFMYMCCTVQHNAGVGGVCSATGRFIY